ncbi:DNA helicase-2/ATP-dependent DNA helicase PcrA [Tamaricihabitans halophyticus]|uniref:DNA 3'-5' helicase n=1 Tax=Tamaricihabitans halophyticus TaxID=1262583 RepID=A0A4V2SUW2_9PSEU|nr:ATP-dependent DNA helicase [Tamaricihabitans halophyticus]TCP56086.1 DNA helicase-2/ATP-dependent DNA helicase PcrA [Tamaricihabitans halophyticus]
MLTPARLASALGLPAPTEEQAAVIAAPPEPALVTAGAGAGKTETMAARVVWLVASGAVAPERVLGLTFTRKAARQLGDRIRARLRRLAGSGLLDELDPSGQRRAAVLTGEPTVLTYHAYAGRLLAEHGLRLPVEPGARLLSETGSWLLAHRVVTGWDGDLDTDKVPSTITQHVLALAGELAEHLVSAEQLSEHADWLCRLVETAPRAARQRAELPQKLRDIVAAQRFRLSLLPLVNAYAERKRAAGALDFADQLTLAAELAANYPAVATAERERYGAVLLDEYQDTGHAQRVLLRSLFGIGAPGKVVEPPPPMPVTAVGDPTQAIYGWRGASAANLPRFTEDFPCLRDGKLVPADSYGLLTSFRNPAGVLELANGVAEPLRDKGLAVARLRSLPDAPEADIRCALLPDVHAEREWLADAVAARWQNGLAADGKPPSTAVLVRRRADMAPLAEQLRARGLPVEVVGLGGLLDEPEVRDLVSALRVLVDPLAGTAAARLLTGARWRLGAADLAALWRRARELAGLEAAAEPAASGVLDALVSGVADTGLVDALDDPGDPGRYSTEGYQRIRKLGSELTALRGRMAQSLPEFVADVERTLLLNIEAMARPVGAGRQHLDAFADVVTEYVAASPSATLTSFLDYLATAEHAEDGLEPGEVEVAEDRVQVLTVHSAKGLEWQVVAVPHLVREVFPSRRRSSCWLRAVTELPASLRGDAVDLPALALSEGMDRKEVGEVLDIHDEEFAERELVEERRLLYVALTRAEHGLLCSGHWWNESSTRPRGPSDFLTELGELVVASGGPEPEHWAPEPATDAENPLLAERASVRWPVDPLGARRAAVREGAELVRAALDELTTPVQLELGQSAETDGEPSAEIAALVAEDADGWVRDTEVLLAERAEAGRRVHQVELPETLSVSQLVELADDPDALARRLRRPLPRPPNAFARRGTSFHTWLEQRFGRAELLDLDELPGAADAEDADAAADAVEVAKLRERFLASAWADRVPHDVEVPFATEVAGIALRGRMDAVYAEPDGGWTVVDWKTGAVPDESRLPALSVQLAAYRLAWAALSDTPVAKVRAAFHYVRADHTVRPADLLDEQGLRALLRSVPRSS